MASVNFMKLRNSNEVGAIMRHCATDTRLSGNHSNTDIDKSLTHLNYDTGTYSDGMDRYRVRLQELDSTTNKNHRKDRVTCYSLEVPAPDTDRDAQVRFLDRAAERIAERYGRENIVYAALHVDEVHDYLDHGEIKTSRPHLHVFVIPEIDGSLNGKKFSSRSSMKSLNQELHRMCRHEFGVDFMTGEHARRRSVEELKTASLIEADNKSIEIAKKASEASERLCEAVKDRQRLKQSTKDIKREYDRVKGKYDHIMDEIPRVGKRLHDLRTKRDEIKRYLTHGSHEAREMMEFMSQYTVDGRPLSEVYVDQVESRISSAFPEGPDGKPAGPDDDDEDFFDR